MNFDKEGSKFEKKMFVCVCVEGTEEWCTDTKTVCKTVFFFFNIFFLFYFFLIYIYILILYTLFFNFHLYIFF